MILVDTSAWIEYLRATGSSAAIELRRLLSDGSGQIAMCEPIAMEILCGATNDTHPALERLVNGLPSLAVDDAVDFEPRQISIVLPGAPAKQFVASTTVSLPRSRSATLPVLSTATQTSMSLRK